MAQLSQGPRLAGPVACLTRRGEGDQVEGRGLIPVTVRAQEVACRSGYGDGILVPSGGGGVVCGGVQVRPLGLQPDRRLLRCGQRGCMGWRLPGRRPVPGGGPSGEVVLGGGHRGVQVVVQQPPRSGTGVGRVAGRCQGAGVLAEQVVQQVAAGCWLGDQVLVIQVFQAAARLVQADVVEGGGGVGVEAGAGDQAQAAEQPLPGPV